MTENKTPKPPLFGRFNKLTKLPTKIVRYTLMTIGAAQCVRWYIALNRGKEKLPDKFILKLSLEQPIAEKPPNFFSRIASWYGITNSPSLLEITNTLEKASKDERVAGVVLELPRFPVAGLAQLQDLRDSIANLKQHNKLTVCYSNEISQFNYYLASACNKVYLQPSSTLHMTGMYAPSIFVKGTLEKLGVVPRFIHTGEYKTAPNIFTESKYTPEHRLQVENLIYNVYDQLIQGFSARGTAVTLLKNLVNEKGAMLSKEALSLRLVDSLLYKDEIDQAIKRELRDDTIKVVSFARYAKNTRTSSSSWSSISGMTSRIPKPKVAVIYATGTISHSENGDDDNEISLNKMEKAFNQAIDDPNVKAIVFRVDSPGGEVVTSESIWRLVTCARAAGKKVVASVSNVAASGGYYIISPADVIVAQPGSIVGSIGVFGGKFIVNKLLEEKLGMTYDTVTIGNHASAESYLEDFTPQQLARWQEHIDNIYDTFLDRVSRGRKLQKEEVANIASGKVYTGEQAKEIGLIDEFGGLAHAINLAKSLALVEDAQVEIYPSKNQFTISSFQNEFIMALLGNLIQNEGFWDAAIKLKPWMRYAARPEGTIMAVSSDAEDISSKLK